MWDTPATLLNKYILKSKWYYNTNQFDLSGVYHKFISFYTSLTLNRLVKINYTFPSPFTAHQSTKIHKNCTESADTELHCGHLGVTLSASIEQNTRNASIAIRCAFPKTWKSGNIGANVTLYTIHTAITPLYTHMHANTQQLHSLSRIPDPTVIQWWRCCVSRMEGRPLLLIKPCYTVKAVCHWGPCESEQSLVTPSHIYQRFLVGGTVSLEENSF